jgi:hypothetical protein
MNGIDRVSVEDPMAIALLGNSRGILAGILGLFLVCAAAHAADDSVIDAMKSGESHSAQVDGGIDQGLITEHAPRHDLTRLRGLSPLVGVVLLIVALIPLFEGWHFLRLALGCLLGVFAGLWMWQYGLPLARSLGGGEGEAARMIHVAGTVFAALFGFVLGWMLYKIQLAASGALLGMLAFSLPGMYLDWPLLILVLMAVGLVVGFILGWLVAPYWAALQTAILGGFLVVQGMAILTQQSSDETMRTIAYASGAAAALVGFIVQCALISKRTPPSP